MSLYYIISVTIIDLISLIFKKSLTSYNNFIRNYFIRICIPFGITSAFVYWELVLLGNNFQHIGHNAYDISESIFLNGIVQFFLFFDMLASHHQYKINRINDIIILTILLICFYLLISFSKFLYVYEPYNFMERSDVRQIIGVGIIVYVLLLNGYLVFDLIALCFFEKENSLDIKQFIKEDNIEISSRDYFFNNSTNLTNQTINLNIYRSNIKQLNLSNKNVLNDKYIINNKNNINNICQNRYSNGNNSLDIELKKL